jgi:PAS domain S-box-containing protein
VRAIAKHPPNRPPNRPPPVVFTPIGLAEQALLTYQALAGSDNIVLTLERDNSAVGSDAIIVAANAAFRQASGFAEDEILGRPVGHLFPLDDHADSLMTAIRNAASLRSELACRRANGGTFMLGMHLMRAPARTAGKDCFVILGRDITVTLQARQLQDSIQQLLAKVFSCVNIAVAIVNSSGHIVMTNRHFNQLLGYKPNGLVGRDPVELVAPGSRASVRALIEQQRANGSDICYSAAVLRSDASELPVHVTSATAITADAKQFRIVTLQPEESARIRSESAGRIQLIGIGEVRTALGDRWPELAERAMATAEAVIKRRCGPQDSYSRSDDISFLVCFGALSEEEASFRAAMIGREIRNRLIGEGESPANAYVRSVAAAVQFSDPGVSGSSLHAILLDGLDKQLERLEQAARQTLQDIWNETACELIQVSGRYSSQIVASQALLPDRLERKLMAALAALPPDEAEVYSRDELLLGLAAKNVIAGMAQGDTTPMLITVSFETFTARAAAERFFSTCAKIDQRVTSRLIMVLSSLPAGLPTTRLLEWLNRLRPYCQAVGYLAEDVAALGAVDLSNSYNPIVSLPAAACSACSPNRLRELFNSLQLRGARVMISGVGSPKDATVLRALGVDMITMKSRTDTRAL